MIRKISILIVFLLIGCSDPNPKQNTSLSTKEQSGRMIIVSAQTITSADMKLRDILILRDRETSKEYLAVMGAGVTEMVSTGKTYQEQ